MSDSIEVIGDYPTILSNLEEALNKPKRWRRRLIRLIFPEIVDIAVSLGHYYMHERCSVCGSIDLESRGGIDSNRYCNKCGSCVHAPWSKK